MYIPLLKTSYGFEFQHSTFKLRSKVAARNLYFYQTLPQKLEEAKNVKKKKCLNVLILTRLAQIRADKMHCERTQADIVLRCSKFLKNLMHDSNEIVT